MKCNCCGVILAIGCCDECDSILEAADTAISAARQIGVPKYGPTSWREDKEHIMKAYCHIRALLIDLGLDPEEYPDYDYEPDEAHLSHAICRLAMAKAVLSE